MYRDKPENEIKIDEYLRKNLLIPTNSLGLIPVWVKVEMLGRKALPVTDRDKLGGGHPLCYTKENESEMESSGWKNCKRSLTR
jgi:hypothetical protein